MKSLITLVLFLVALPFVSKAESFYRAGEFSIDAFGTLRTDDFEEERTGLGLGLNYFFSRNFGLGIEGSSEGTSGVLVDAGRVHAIYRIPIQKSAPYIFAGGGPQFEGDADWAFDFGVGLEVRLRKNVGVFGDLRLDKIESQGSTMLGRLGVRFNF